MKSKAVIFDMDGVIIDSEGLWRQAQKDALAGWGVTVNDEECETLTKGKRLDEIARVWCEYCPLQTDPGVLESAIRKRITGLIAMEGEAMDGVYAVLHHFRHRGYRIALATSSSHQVIEAVLSKLNLLGHFDVICSADDERYGKPHPAVYLSALKKLGLPAAECLVIEDSLSGFRAAQAAGIDTIVVSDGCQHPCFSEAIGRYTSMPQLLETLAPPVRAAG
ncbi:HAD family hydrolase [Citrobacter koseri]|uniref:HAD family hydrolase n=1 Tax=Citrobacter koseri TaxID=545 RepID=UPI003CF9580A